MMGREAWLELYERRSAERRETVRDWNGHTEASVSFLSLPWPPSGNAAVRHTKAGGHYVRKAVVEYRQTVAALVLASRSRGITGRYELYVEMSPPDARRRDIDNALKSLFDALVQASWLPDDAMSVMRKLVVTINDDRRGEVRVRAHADRAVA